MGLWQKEQREEEVGRVEYGGSQEREAKPGVAEQPAEDAAEFTGAP